MINAVDDSGGMRVSGQLPTTQNLYSANLRLVRKFAIEKKPVASLPAHPLQTSDVSD